ncbi:MAG: phage tail protein, partial [Candidatus Methylomirabilis sp.]|nr:phage tail protein [Deltaproteobacteria bacterium]
MIFMRLGGIELSGAESPRPFQWEEPNSLVRQEIAVGKPRVHSAGDGLRELTLEVRLTDLFSDPKAVIARMRAAKSAGEVLDLARGDGTYDGAFVIEKFTVSEESLGPDGAVRTATVRIGLVEYAEDAPLA